MSKPVKKLMRKEFAKRFEGLESLAVVGFTGLDGKATTAVRARLQEKNIAMTVVKNSLARQAFKDIGLDKAASLLEGPSAVAYPKDPQQMDMVAMVRELLDIGKESPALTVKAAMLEGADYIGDEQIKELSNYPTREEAVAKVVTSILSAGANIGGAMLGPGRSLGGALKAMEQQEGESQAA